jgi:hypothetical protein
LQFCRFFFAVLPLFFAVAVFFKKKAATTLLSVASCKQFTRWTSVADAFVHIGFFLLPKVYLNLF